MNDPMLRIEDLVVDYEIREGALRAADHVFLDVPTRGFLGLIGESGCGKTTIVDAVLNVMPENGYIRQGKVILAGQDILSLSAEEQRRLRWERVAMVFQAAQNSLNPVLTVWAHVADTVLAHRKASKDWIADRARELLRLVQLDPERVLHAYPHELSGGMKQRVIIATSLLLDPEMLVLDEPTTALDLISQAYLMETLLEIHRQLEITMMLVTHDVANVARVADRVAVMYAAKIVEVGPVEDVFYRACHPYTVGLLSAIPSILGDPAEKRPIPGLPPSLIAPPPGCRFHPRCLRAVAPCFEVEPRLMEVGTDRLAACHNPVG
jgi:peptide/nickel transport system ATP-binding protein